MSEQKNPTMCPACESEKTRYLFTQSAEDGQYNAYGCTSCGHNFMLKQTPELRKLMFERFKETLK